MTILLLISLFFIINALIVMAAIRSNRNIRFDAHENLEQAHALEKVTAVTDTSVKIKTAIMPVEKPSFTSRLLRQENSFLREQCRELEYRIASLEQTITELRRKVI